MNKKAFGLLLVLGLGATLVACGPSGGGDTTTPAASPDAVSPGAASPDATTPETSPTASPTTSP